MVRVKEEIEKRPGGAVAVQIFEKSQLAHDNEVVDAVSSGVADIGTTATHNYAKTAPAISFLDLPFLFNFKTLSRRRQRPAARSGS
jgi:TRAP-type C4-dicarboxylate transport system substrate-binding protein